MTAGSSKYISLFPFYIVSAFCLFFLWELLPGAAYAATVNANTSSVLAQAAQQIAADLDNKVMLSGKKIQVSENNFWERGTRINLPFSAVLRDALAAALSDCGATVTAQEIGREPWRLVGTYGIEGTDLVITARIRLMGETASGDIAVAGGKAQMASLDQAWFKPEFGRVARTLVRLLEENYHGIDEMAVEISLLKPGLRGQPSLLLGQEFLKFLESAVADSPLFGSSDFGTGASRVRMEGTYARVEAKKDQKMHFHIRVVDSHNRMLTSANFDVDLGHIPNSLLKPIAEKEIKVCTIYVPALSRDLPAESPAAITLLNYVSEALAEHGIIAEACQPGCKRFVRVEASMQIRKKCISGGYVIASGKIKLKVVSSNGRIIGTLPKDNKLLLKHNLDEAAEQIVKKLFNNKKVGYELAAMILGR